MATPRVEPGAPVYTSDGVEIGNVAEVRRNAFRIDISMMPDYWLPLSAVQGSTGEVTLSCTEEAIEAQRIADPTEVN
jgi:hypothetical protein